MVQQADVVRRIVRRRKKLQSGAKNRVIIFPAFVRETLIYRLYITADRRRLLFGRVGLLYVRLPANTRASEAGVSQCSYRYSCTELETLALYHFARIFWSLGK